MANDFYSVPPVADALWRQIAENAARKVSHLPLIDASTLNRDRDQIHRDWLRVDAELNYSNRD